MPDADIDALSELRFVPKFLETAVETACLEIALLKEQDMARPHWADALLKEWQRYVRWRAHTTQNPALLGNVALEIEGALTKLRSASAMMAGKGPLLEPRKNAVAEGFDGR